MNRKGQIQIGAIVGSIIALIFLIVVGFVSVDILQNAGLLTSGSDFETSTNLMVGNLTDGVNSVSAKIPTVFSIAIAVLLLGLIVFLVARARQAQQIQGGTL